MLCEGDLKEAGQRTKGKENPWAKRSGPGRESKSHAQDSRGSGCRWQGAGLG